MSPALANVTPSPLGLKRTLLLVEDSPSEVQIMQRALRDISRAVSLNVVRDGQEALDFLLCRGRFAAFTDRAPPDLVLLDLHLPRLTGLEVLGQIRGNATLRALPVVVWTSSGQAEDIRAGYEAGASSYIEKPRDYDRFREVLETVFRYWFDTARLPAMEKQA